MLPPLLGSTRTSIWYARHPSLARFDPLESALQAMAQPKIHERLPESPEESAGCQGIIVATPHAGGAPYSGISIDRFRNTSTGASLPVLILAPSREGVPLLPDGVEFSEYPVSLAILHQFVSRPAVTSRTSAAA
jgi:hypothetical protein